MRMDLKLMIKSRLVDPMGNIHKSISVNKSNDVAFTNFVLHINSWWPKKYTWSQEALESISIDPVQGGLCTERGPSGFRCDWGRVLERKQGEKIVFLWQIGPNRVPEPDPSKASRVTVTFSKSAEGGSSIHLEHGQFENHGEEGENYRKAMDSELGWDYILNSFVKYCNL